MGSCDKKKWNDVTRFLLNSGLPHIKLLGNFKSNHVYFIFKIYTTRGQLILNIIVDVHKKKQNIILSVSLHETHCCFE